MELRTVRSRSLSAPATPKDTAMRVQTSSFDLNEAKNLKKKLKAANRTTPVLIASTGGGVRLTLQAGLYEVFKTVLPEFYGNKQLFPCGYELQKKLDKAGNCVQDTIRVKAAEDANLYVLNLYHTTSRVLVNGAKEYIFLEKHFPELIKELGNAEKQVGMSARALNNYVKKVLTTYFKENAPEDMNGRKTSRIPKAALHKASDPDRRMLTNTATLSCIARITEDTDEDLGEPEDISCPACEALCVTKSVYCTVGMHWIHYKCDGLSGERIQEMETDMTDDYTCKSCEEISSQDEDKEGKRHTSTETKNLMNIPDNKDAPSTTQATERSEETLIHEDTADPCLVCDNVVQQSEESQYLDPKGNGNGNTQAPEMLILTVKSTVECKGALDQQSKVPDEKYESKQMPANLADGKPDQDELLTRVQGNQLHMPVMQLPHIAPNIVMSEDATVTQNFPSTTTVKPKEKEPTPTTTTAKNKNSEARDKKEVTEITSGSNQVVQSEIETDLHIVVAKETPTSTTIGQKNNNTTTVKLTAKKPSATITAAKKKNCEARDKTEENETPTGANQPLQPGNLPPPELENDLHIVVAEKTPTRTAIGQKNRNGTKPKTSLIHKDQEQDMETRMKLLKSKEKLLAHREQVVKIKEREVQDHTHQMAKLQELVTTLERKVNDLREENSLMKRIAYPQAQSAPAIHEEANLTAQHGQATPMNLYELNKESQLPMPTASTYMCPKQDRRKADTDVIQQCSCSCRNTELILSTLLTYQEKVLDIERKLRDLPGGSTDDHPDRCIIEHTEKHHRCEPLNSKAQAPKNDHQDSYEHREKSTATHHNGDENKGKNSPTNEQREESTSTHYNRNREESTSSLHSRDENMSKCSQNKEHKKSPSIGQHHRQEYDLTQQQKKIWCPSNSGNNQTQDHLTVQEHHTTHKKQTWNSTQHGRAAPYSGRQYGLPRGADKMPEGRPSNGYSSKKQRKETDPDKACWNPRPSIATQGLNNQRQQRDILPLGRQPQVPVHGKPVKRQTSRVFYNTKYQKPPTDGQRNTNYGQSSTCTRERSYAEVAGNRSNPPEMNHTSPLGVAVQGIYNSDDFTFPRGPAGEREHPEQITQGNQTPFLDVDPPPLCQH